MKKRASLRALLGLVELASVLLVAGCAAPPGPPRMVEKPVFPAPPDQPRFYYERSIYTSADVVKQDQNAELRRMLTGESRVGEGMAKPYGVAVYQGRVFVSDTAVQAVMVFDIPGQKFFKIGEEEPGRLMMPIGLDVDGKGNLYVVDATAKQVVVYDKDGKFLRTVGNAKFFSRPSGIAVDSEGARVYVVDTGSVTNEEHRVRVFDAQDGKHLLDIGKRGNAKGEFNLPRDVVIGQDGLIYVVDGGNFRVQAFRTDGTFVRAFGEVGRRSGQFSRPKEAAVDPEGNIYVVDTAFGNFQIFNPEGQLLLPVGSRSEKDGMAKYMLPAGIAIDGDGRVYVADQFFRKVDVYRPATLAEGAGFAVRPEPKGKQ
ncbi:6-bladed beta-propeller [Noviherbaspirillum sp.]|uniref:6-bladed beta-propeller n=1 Tax=Noviherbaspirillum sp. TaxID=1926288 RepID=UPI002B46E194|nr:6-bladed beta-propeller [Noviherbaspirillum sp.]HJV81292.1 6-bladed beta-propeller [Noviherbaspirillum sp.]